MRFSECLREPAYNRRRMSVLAIILIVLAAVVLVFLLGGMVVSRRRSDRPDWDRHIRAADRALEQARAEDRGWDRELLHAAARAALTQERPGFEPASLALVRVDDRPGVEKDRAHVLATAADGDTARVVLARDSAGEWGFERLE